MSNIIKKSKEFAAAAVLATLPFTAFAADNAPAIDKVANSEKAANCVIDKFKNNVTTEFNRISAEAPQIDRKNILRKVLNTTMLQMDAHTMDCISEVTGVPKDQMPEVPTVEDYFANPEKFAKQAQKMEEFLSTYMPLEAYDEAMKKGMENDILPFLENMLNGTDKAAPAPAPKP